MVLDFGQNFLSPPRPLLPIYAKDILHIGRRGWGCSRRDLCRRLDDGCRHECAWRSQVAGAMAIGRCYRLWPIQHRLRGVHVVLALICDARRRWRRKHPERSRPRHGKPAQHSRRAARGRVTGVSSTFTSSSPQLGQFEVGALASAVGPDGAAIGRHSCIDSRRRHGGIGKIGARPGDSRQLGDPQPRWLIEVVEPSAVVPHDLLFRFAAHPGSSIKWSPVVGKVGVEVGEIRREHEVLVANGGDHPGNSTHRPRPRRNTAASRGTSTPQAHVPVDAGVDLSKLLAFFFQAEEPIGNP